MIILDLPDELFLECIFPFLLENKEDVGAVQMVCSRFNQLLHIEYMFERMCLKRYKEEFTHYLPPYIMKRYYNDSYRRMFFLDNKYRYHHYCSDQKIEFRHPDEVRRYDRKNGSDVENQILQTMCMYMFAHSRCSDYFSERKFTMSDGTRLTLEIVFNTVQNEYSEPITLITFFPSKDPICETEEVDGRFPKYRMIYHWPGDNQSGFVYEDNSKHPLFENSDGSIESLEFVDQETFERSFRARTRRRKRAPIPKDKVILEKVLNDVNDNNRGREIEGFGKSMEMIELKRLKEREFEDKWWYKTLSIFTLIFGSILGLLFNCLVLYAVYWFIKTLVKGEDHLEILYDLFESLVHGKNEMIEEIGEL